MVFWNFNYIWLRTGLYHDLIEVEVHINTAVWDKLQLRESKILAPDAQGFKTRFLIRGSFV